MKKNLIFQYISCALLGISNLFSTGVAVPKPVISTMVVADFSGSMRREINGISKEQWLKSSLRTALSDQSSSFQVGLTVFGASEHGQCKDVQTLLKPTVISLAQWDDLMNHLQPKGMSPLAFALREAATVLQANDTNGGTLLLISDGRDNCHYDACARVNQWWGTTSFGMRLDVIGLGVNKKSRAQLQCLAQVGNGDYFDVSPEHRHNLVQVIEGVFNQDGSVRKLAWLDDNSVVR